MSTPPLREEDTQPARPRYQLKLEPDGRSWTVRENLTDILTRELLGPANGPDEVIEDSPDAVYLIGKIAPYRLTGVEPTPARDDEEPPVDSAEAATGQGVPVEGTDESVAADEDSTEDAPQQRGVMAPASMGLRFQVPKDLAEAVTAMFQKRPPEFKGE